jgi:hypothetical protein
MEGQEGGTARLCVCVASKQYWCTHWTSGHTEAQTQTVADRLQGPRSSAKSRSNTTAKNAAPQPLLPASFALSPALTLLPAPLARSPPLALVPIDLMLSPPLLLARA